MNLVNQKDFEDFLAVAEQFKLGGLTTEGLHPLTLELSSLVVTDPGAAALVLQDADKLALKQLCSYSAGIAELSVSIKGALLKGSRIFLCGCGSTGRLALSLEVLGRQGLLPEEYRDSVIGFMAGGDAALIKSIESFEDHPEYGVKQMKELGFTRDDLLIAITEGGETPFVIGAVEYAAEYCVQQPWFLYCNEDDVLMQVAERSRLVIENPRIRKLNLTVGPMAISGSTRMQASTVQMAAVGYCLFCDSDSDLEKWFEDLYELVEHADYAQLAPFIVRESKCYEEGRYLLYRTSEHGITVLTDTTERAPTFSLAPFENMFNKNGAPSLSYLCITGACSSEKAWKILLQREPRCLEWGQYADFSGREYFMGFDISDKGAETRRMRVSPAELHEFDISFSEGSLRFDFVSLNAQWNCGDADLLQQHLLLKMLLNAHSTLVMGRLGRYEGNMMTWVKPSNNKLIDRSIRYISEFWRRQTGKEIAYRTVAEALFNELETLSVGEPIVIKTLDRLHREVSRA